MDAATIKRRGTALAFGLVCHGAFLCGVAMMIYQMYFGMSRTFGAVAFPWNWIVNGLLLIQFPLAHSLLLSGRGRLLLKHMAPARYAVELSTTTYVIIASLQILLLFSLWTFSGIIWWQAEGTVHVMLTLLYAASWLLLGKAILDAGISLQTGSLGWWAVFRNKRPCYPGLPTGGLFRFCRQPIYFAFACTLWTVPRWTPDQLVVALALTAYCLTGPLFKEARFARLFGDSFAAYRQSHPYWLPLPHIHAKLQALNNLSIYERHAAHWWDGSQRWLRTLQNLVPARLQYFDQVIDWRGRQVLDLGCGGGFMAEALARRGAIVTGIDPSAGAIAIAESHAAAKQLPISYLTAKGESLPFADRSFDHVVCVDVLEHVGNLDAVISEIRRVLRPGGTLAFDTINRGFLARVVIVTLGERILGLLPRGTHDPAKFITPDELTEKLRNIGFDAFHLAGLGPKGINWRLDFTFGRLPFLAIQYMGYARLPA
jgi:ubiquinone biosynthesis O-methyltransferase